MDIARIQDDWVGGGTTTVTVMLGELLRETDKLAYQEIHPKTISAGWRIEKAREREAFE